ncbi:MAG TPA: substrate-binding domain-containing protein, partial [Longimicrobiales bacterium]
PARPARPIQTHALDASLARYDPDAYATIMSDPRIETRVREARGRRGWSQEMLAARAGISRAAVSAIETGRVVPSTAAALALAAALECRVEELFRLDAARGEDAVTWAWAPGGGAQRFWLAEVGGRLLHYPVETTAAGLLPHDGVVVVGGAEGVAGPVGASGTVGTAGTAGGGRAAGAGRAASSDVTAAARAATEVRVGSTARAASPWGVPAAARAGAMPRPDPRRTLVVAGCDPAAGLLATLLGNAAGVRVLPFVRSSGRSLELLRDGRIHVAGVHLGAGPEENERLVRERLGPGFRLLHVARWMEGVALAPGLGVRSVPAALDAGLRWVGREEGSGARRCLEQLFEGRDVSGLWQHAASDHRGVVDAIRAGWAQAGICVRLVAEDGGLAFLPVRTEAYDLCYRADMEDDPRLAALLDAVRSVAFRRLLGDLPGYDVQRTGERS